MTVMCKADVFLFEFRLVCNQQQHIASYLKITPQSLSRIRKELAKGKHGK